MVRHINSKNICIFTAVIAVILLILTGCKRLYDKGYEAGYDAGYTACAEAMSIPIEVKPNQTVATVKTVTETVVKPKTKPGEPSVVIKTKEPEIVASVNGKKYDFKPTTEILETGIKTTGVISVKIPERKTVVGVGTDGRHVAGMIKVPVKIGTDATGLWIAGTKGKVMGGVSISF